MEPSTLTAARAVLVVACLSAAAGCAYAGADQARPPEAVAIDVIGNSLVGIRYQKRGEIEAAGNGYVARYWLDNGWGFRADLSRREPDCAQAVGRDHPAMRALMRFLEGLPDWGEAAKCCDGPWSEIELRYTAGGGRTLLVGEDVFEREQVKPLAACFGG